MSKYKLLGEMWDGCTTKNYKIKQNADLTKVIFYNESNAVRDRAAKISLSEILNAKKEHMLKIVDELKNFETVYIIMDCTPKIKNEIVQSFFEKRLRQINYVLSNSLNGKINIFFINAN